MRTHALVGGTIFVTPFDPPILDGTVLVEGEKIGAVGLRAEVPVAAGAKVIDCAGAAITAGFWNSHVHFFERQWADAGSIPAAELTRQLRSLTRYGFTNVFDLSSPWENTRRIRDRIVAGEVPGPFVRSTGEGLVPPGGIPSEAILRVLGIMPSPHPEISDETVAIASVRELLARGVDAIKVFASGAPPQRAQLRPEIVQAVVQETHCLQKPVFVHPNTGDEALLALCAGVDVIAHTTPAAGPWPSSMYDAVATHKAALTPTLALWKHSLRHDRASMRDRIVGEALRQLSLWILAGGTVLFGTDVGAIDADPTDEYSLMQLAGMNVRQILASLTIAPAEFFGAGTMLGQVKAGFQADLAVLAGNPFDGVSALSDVRYTLRAGEVIYDRQGCSV